LSATITLIPAAGRVILARQEDDRMGDRYDKSENWLRSLWRISRPRKRRQRSESQREQLKQTYERFKEILSLNDATLQLIADIEDRVTGRIPFSMNVFSRRIREASVDSFVMARDLDQICPGRYDELPGVVRRISTAIDAELTRAVQHLAGPILVPLARLTAASASIAGTKMANLGEIANVVGLNVPEGFVITTSAFAKFMEREELQEKASRLEEILELYGARVAEEACRQLQNQVIAAPLPPELEKAIMEAYDTLGHGEEVLVAVRSSSIKEDSAFSHAGQYYTELNVGRGWLLDTYNYVLASTFGIGPVTYRHEHGLTGEDAAMAVGCLRMLEPRCSGVMFTRDFNDPDADRIVISVEPGLGGGVTSGRLTAEALVVSLDNRIPVESAHVSEHDITQLVSAARRLEDHFQGPQDIEWAIDAYGRLYILQSRPMALPARSSAVQVSSPDVHAQPILSGGRVACPGGASGPVFVLRHDDDLARVPEQCVLVAQHSAPKYSLVMRRCAAIVTDMGSPIGHMAILSREYGVPTIVGLDGATTALESGRVVTVDATNLRVYDGDILPALSTHEEYAPLKGSPAVRRLKAVAAHVTPLKLIDPHGPDFSAGHCRSLHDVTRFIHEKVFEVVFYLGSEASSRATEAPVLGGNLPINVHVLDVGGGLVDGVEALGQITQQDIISIPMKSFLEGLTDPRLKWDKPRAVSARGFASVLGESISGAPAEARGVGRASYAIISDRYMNFSTKAGYHFNTVDTYCGKSLNKNYVHFRFEGGAADEVRRERRCRFLVKVLTELGFKTQCRGDVLVARLEKYDAEIIKARLVQLGRATLCCRQLDMLMDTDASPDHFAQAFLDGELERFF
jgi:pyruvate,water dikinase